MELVWLAGLGLGVGTFGTLVGAGGGFILMPIFVLLYPSESADRLTGISLAVVFFNAFSGSFAYAFRRRINYRAGVIFALASVPGALLGAYWTKYISRSVFDPLFGSILVLAAVYLWVRPLPESPVVGGLIARGESQEFVHELEYDLKLGLFLSFGVGIVSSLLGIGGGIIHVPLLVHLLNFPIHIATATSHFILAVMTLAGTGMHIMEGSFASGANELIVLTPSVMVGAQLGAYLSKKLHGTWIIRVLAIALGVVGLRLLMPVLLSVVS